MRRITIYWWKGKEKLRVAEIAQGRGTPIMLEWDRDFLGQAVELSPIRFRKQPGVIQCPNEPFEGLPGLLADHVPDGWGRILLRRGLHSRGIMADDISPLDMLQYLGDRAMGALSFEPSLRAGELWAEGKVALDSLAHGVGAIISGTASDVLGQFISGGASPLGIRPKIILKEQGKTFYVGRDALEAPEWIVKFRAPEDPPDSGKLEYIYSLMAKSAGVRVPKTRLLQTHTGHYFAARRFDRDAAGRVHMHTLSGLLQAGPGNFSVGYEHFAKVAHALTSDMRAVTEVYRIAAFNVLGCNQDDHSRNAAFLMNAAGSWSVAPAYDLTFYETGLGEHKMGMGGGGKLGEQDLRRFGAEVGLSKAAAKEVLERTKEALGRFKRLAREHEVSQRVALRVSKAIERGLMKAKKKP